MKKVVINAENIILALERDFTKENMKYFEDVVGNPLTSYILVLANLITFDLDKLLLMEYIHMSIKDQLIKRFGQEFTNFFRCNILHKPRLELARITERSDAW